MFSFDKLLGKEVGEVDVEVTIRQRRVMLDDVVDICFDGIPVIRIARERLKVYAVHISSKSAEHLRSRGVECIPSSKPNQFSVKIEGT